MSQAVKCEVCGFDNPPGHFYCGRCGNNLAIPDSNTSTSLLKAPIEGERKQVTIIFADISGFTALNDAATKPAEVEQVIRIINYLLNDLSEVIYEFDGYIDKYIGDAIMAIFGAPRAHEDDPERALRAALAMQERLEKFNQNPPAPLPEPLGIHMGINTGTVIAGMVGTDRKRSYTVMGDAVNVASRLEGVSERGEILISETTYNLTNRLFVFEEREPVVVKGKREPLKIYQVKAARDLNQTQRGLTGMEAPLIGREYEIKTLLKRYDELRTNKHGGIIAIVGEAGLGKSRLLSEFKKQINKTEDNEDKPLWLFGRGLSYRQSFSNRLFVDILHSYLELPENPDDSQTNLKLEAMGEKLFGPRQEDVVPLLATLLGLKLDDKQASNLPLDDPQILQQRIFLAVGEWIEVLAAERPVLMVFEDTHWADPSSVALVEYLFTLVMYNPVLIVCVTRPERESNFWNVKLRSAQDYPDRFTELNLWPLTDAESRQLIQQLLRIEQMPKSAEDLLLSRAEGNPLFLEEVLRSLIEAGAIELRDNAWQISRSVNEIDIPNTLQGVLTARIDRLEESVKRVLQVAAVIGRVFPRFVLEPIVNDPDALQQALNQLEAAELIEVRTHEPQPEYMFKHVLTYETSYQSLLHQQRKTIHKQIADHMARLYWELGEEYAPIVAEHYYKSESWPRAVRYLQRAAETAIQSFANQQAVEFYSRALEVAALMGPEADQAALLSIYEGRARLLTRLGEPQQATADYEAMLAKARELADDLAEMRALNGIGSLHASHYDFSMAAEYFREALAVARRIGDKLGMADTLNQLGNFYYNMGQLETATKCYREGYELSTAMGDEQRQVDAEEGLAKVMVEQGEIAAGLERYEQLVKARRRMGYRSSLMYSLSLLQVAQTFAADYKVAAETAEEALELHHKSGDVYRVPFIRFYQAFGQLYQGELGKAGENLKEGLRLAHEQKQKSWQALGLAWLSYYYLVLGLDQEGLQQAQQSNQIAEELGSPLYVMRAQSMLGTAYRHLGRLEDAIGILENVHSVTRSMGFAPDEVMILYQLIRVYMDTDQWDKAEENLKRLLALALASEMKEFITRGQWLQALVHTRYQHYDKALDNLIRASELAEQTDSRLSQYLIQTQKAYVYHLSGNVPASRDALAYAQKLQKRLADTLPDEVTRQAFYNNHYASQLQRVVQANARTRPT